MPNQELYKGPNHAVNLNNMRLTDKYCDITIEVNGQTIRAHKVILAANLKYFETMFSSDSFDESEGGLVTMYKVEKTDLELFVSYAYTGEILLTDSNALDLLDLANYLGQDDIKKACVGFLEKHLKAEDAGRAYKLANKIECFLLKNAAKAKIIGNFREFSKRAYYLNSDSETLMDILSDGKFQSAETQKVLLEGIMKWILHDGTNRKFCLEDLLSSIDISKLPANDIKSCLEQYTVRRISDYGMTKDVMNCYVASKIARRKREKVLMVIDADGFFSFYNFTAKKWSSREQIPNAAFRRYENSSSAVLNDKLYYHSHVSREKFLQVFDPSSKQVTRYPFERFLKYASLCACSRFVYICGGSKDDHSRSSQLLRFDPQTDYVATLASMGHARSNPAAIFYQDCIYVLGGSDGSSDLQSVEKYDPAKNEWTALAPMSKRRCGLAVAILNEKLYACGGHGDGKHEMSVEMYDPKTESWYLVASIIDPRAYFLMVAHEGKLLAIRGEGRKTVETYDLIKNQWQMDDEMSSGLDEYFYVGGLISPSCIADTK